MEMTENKIFSCTLVVSLIIHAVILSKLSFDNSRLLKDTVHSLEITYQPIKALTRKNETQMRPPLDSRMPSQRPPKETKIFEQKQISPGVKIFLKDQPDGPPLIKDMAKLSHQWQLDKDQSARIDIHPPERKITVPELKSEKIRNPVYLNYYQVIRSKIKDRAYLNYSRTDAGEVYLTFVLASDGSLKQIRLINEKTSAGDYLKDLGLKSIRESSPFPSFPSDLKYPELSFNVVISFEIKN